MMFDRRIVKHLRYIEETLVQIAYNQEKHMLTSQQIVDKVNEVATKEEALIVLAKAQKTNLAEVRAELQAALAANDQPAMQAAIDKLQEVEDHVDATITDLGPNPPSPPTPGP